MNSTTLETINEKLKDKPENVLKQVLGYLDGILEDDTKDLKFELSDEQKQNLDDIKKRNYSDHTEIESFLNDFKSEYEI